MCQNGILSAKSYGSCSAYADAYASAYTECQHANVALKINQDCSAQANANTDAP